MGAGALSLPGLSSAIQTAVSPYRRPKLKITDVKTAFIGAHGAQLHVRVYTDQGLIGQGEATDAAVGGGAIIASWRQRLIGRDPLNVEAIWEQIRTSGIFAGAQGGQYVTALSGLEIALWDLAGKAVGLPVYQLLGGKVRDRIRVYCDSAAHHPGEPGAKEKIAEIQAMGFTAMKIDIDEAGDPSRWDRVNWTASNGEVDRMVKEVAFVRGALDKRVDLAVDMHGRRHGHANRAANSNRSSCCGWRNPFRPRTSTPCATCASPPKRPSAPARICSCATASASCSKSAPSTSSCRTCRSAAACSNPARSPTWPTPTTFPWRRTVVSPIGYMASCHVCAAIRISGAGVALASVPTALAQLQGGRDHREGLGHGPDRPGIGVEMNEEAVRSPTSQHAWFDSARN
jgi:L-alanine-DL-glutamate epimerase-like enolase superfamily enzyme